MAQMLFILLCLIWGSSFILMKYAAMALGPISIGAWRVVSGAAVLGLLWSTQHRAWPMSRSDLGPMLLVVVLGYALPFVAQPYVINHSSSALMGMVVGLSPLLTMVMSVPMLGLRPTPRQAVGVLGGLGFLALLLRDAFQAQVSPLVLLIAVSVPTTYAIANTFVKRRFAATAPMPLSCAALTLSAALLLPLSLTLEPVGSKELLTSSLAVLTLGIFGTGLAGWFSYKLIQDHGPLHAGMVTYVVPVVALAWGWGDGERINALQIISLAGILVMVALVQWNPRKPRVPHPPNPA